MNPLKRHSLAITVLTAALFLLQGPLCAVGCFTNAGVSALTATELAASETQPDLPCHASESSPSSSSTPRPAPTGSGDDCGCEDGPVAVAASADLASSIFASLAIEAPRPAWRAATWPPLRRPVASPKHASAQSPPPDLQILHSSFLI